jgi:hypothetical protein
LQPSYCLAAWSPGGHLIDPVSFITCHKTRNKGGCQIWSELDHGTLNSPLKKGNTMSEIEKQPRKRPPSTERKIGRAILYAILCAVFTVLTFTFGNGANGKWLFVLFFVPAFLLGRASYRHFKRRYSDTFTEEVLDGESPVLFLRPFEQDSGWDGAAAFSLYRPSTWTWRKCLLLSPTNLTALYLEMTGRLSFEQVLAHVVRKIGALVAIGEPGHPPILGARNIYVGDDNWQEQVRALTRRSSLVVLTAGTSEGVLWEVGNSMHEVSPDRFMLNVPGASRAQRTQTYAAFQPLAVRFFPAGLPDSLKGARFLTFGDGWQPMTGKVRRPAKGTPPWVARRLKALLL